jgi:hypothetical protein
MEDSHLLALAVATALAGLGVLYFAAAGFEPEVVGVAELDEGYMGRMVHIEGVVSRVKEYNKSMAFFLEQNGSEVQVYMFFKLPVEVNQSVGVYGEVQEYNGELEVVPARVEDIVFK